MLRTFTDEQIETLESVANLFIGLWVDQDKQRRQRTIPGYTEPGATSLTASISSSGMGFGKPAQKSNFSEIEINQTKRLLQIIRNKPNLEKAIVWFFLVYVNYINTYFFNREIVRLKARQKCWEVLADLVYCGVVLTENKKNELLAWSLAEAERMLQG